MYYNIHGYAADGERESEAFASYFEDIFLPEFEFYWWEEVGRNELYYYLDQLDDNLKTWIHVRSATGLKDLVKIS